MNINIFISSWNLLELWEENKISFIFLSGQVTKNARSCLNDIYTRKHSIYNKSAKNEKAHNNISFLECNIGVDVATRSPFERGVSLDIAS